MDLYFLNKDRELVGIIDTAKSAQWLERYFEVGTFEIYVQVTDEVKDIVNQSYFVARLDSTYVGLIERVETEDDKDNGSFLIIQGRMAEQLIGRRIIRTITHFINRKLLDICTELLNANILNPVLQEGETTSPRKMYCFNTNIINNLSEEVNITIGEVQASFENNLLTFNTDLLKLYNSGLRVELTNDNQFNIVLYTGTDRSYNQSENPYVVFSKEYDNLISSRYVYDSTKYANAIYVGGENNDTAAEGRYVDKYELPDPTTASGVVDNMDRVEAFVNASDLKQKWEDEDKVTHQLSTNEYRKLLQARGKESITSVSRELGATIELTNYIYNEDFFLGDIVTIYNETLGVYTNKRLTGMDIVDNESGQTLEPTFDDVVIPEEETLVEQGVLLAEDGSNLTTENGANLLVEDAEPSAASTYSLTKSSSSGSVKISELEEVNELYDGCCMPIVQNGETKKVTYNTMKEQLINEIPALDEVDILAAIYDAENS